MPRPPEPSSQPPGQHLETDPRFPSGPWTGFWLQQAYTGRQWMRLTLTFRDGAISGGGSDRIGNFEMHGSYDLASGACSILKTYHGAHTVTYEGKNEGDGMWIWGLWTIRAFDRGGFHLWPEGKEDPTSKRLSEEQELESEQPRIRLVPVEVE